MGFVMRAADTPAQIERLRQLPPRTFVARSKNGRRYYLYADPDYCKCVFVGDETAMRNYRDMVSPPPQAPMAIGPGKPSVAETGDDYRDHSAHAAWLGAVLPLQLDVFSAQRSQD